MPFQCGYTFLPGFCSRSQIFRVWSLEHETSRLSLSSFTHMTGLLCPVNSISPFCSGALFRFKTSRLLKPEATANRPSDSAAISHSQLLHSLVPTCFFPSGWFRSQITRNLSLAPETTRPSGSSARQIIPRTTHPGFHIWPWMDRSDPRLS